MRIKEALLVLLGMAVFAMSLALARFGAPGGAADKKHLVLQLSWRASVASGGFVQAAVKGFYRDCGVEVELRQGGASMDPAQLLVQGAVDAAQIPHSDSVMYMNNAGFKARAVFASMQTTPASLVLHADSPIQSVGEMAGRPIMISATTRSTWWPFLKMRYGFTDDQIRPFNGQARFIADKTAIEQGVITEGPYALWEQARLKIRYFRLSDLGYNPYGGVLTVSQLLIDEHPETVRCLVQGSQRGWADYMKDPHPSFAEIMRMAPEETPGLLVFGWKAIHENHLVETPETARIGIGAMTVERWRSHAKLLMNAGLLPRDFDASQVYDDRFLGSLPRSDAP
jgi:NitT/TauT family transport system substrate-binding protein